MAELGTSGHVVSRAQRVGCECVQRLLLHVRIVREVVSVSLLVVVVFLVVVVEFFLGPRVVSGLHVARHVGVCHMQGGHSGLRFHVGVMGKIIGVHWHVSRHRVVLTGGVV